MQYKINTKNIGNSSILTRLTLVLLALMIFSSVITVAGKFAFADSRYDDQIHSSKKDADEQAQHAEKLSRMAENYQAELVQLQNQSKQIQDSLDKSQKQQEILNNQLKDIEKDLTENQEILSNIVVDIQIESEITPLEMIASSKTMAEYVDRQAQQSAILRSLDKEILKIVNTKKQIKKHQAKIAREVAIQKNQREQLAQKEAEKQKLINETRGQEALYRKLASANNERVQNLRSEQAEQNRKATELAMRAFANRNIPAGILGGDYPFTQGPLDYGVDPWGLYYRECVSYAAWKVASTGRFVPHFGGMGNANQWPATVAKFGIMSGNEPKEGAVAMQNIGAYGHVMYVEKVHEDNSITVSDYNLEWDGLYRKYQRSSGGLTYIYF